MYIYMFIHTHTYIYIGLTPPTSLLYAMHLTRSVVTISCKGVSPNPNPVVIRQVCV